MKDIVLITIDALRQDHFSSNYFPESWDEYLEDFAYFENAYSNGVGTALSFPSIHTGYPVDLDGQLKSDTPTLAEIYNGYTFGISNNPHLRPDRGYNRGFDSFTRDPTNFSNKTKGLYYYVRNTASKSETLKKMHRLFYETILPTEPNLSPSSEKTATSVLSRLKQSVQSRSGFFWVHLMDPHAPYYPQKVMDHNLDVQYSNSEIEKINNKITAMSLRSMGLESEITELPQPTEEEIEFCRRMYTEIVKYTYRAITDFFDYLKRNNRWKESMIILMSDHGEAFGEQGVFQHDWSADPIDALIRIPLAVKYPQDEFSGKTYSHPVQAGDLFATLSEALGLSTNIPSNTCPFTERGNRLIISKSNNAVRVTTSGGYAIRRGDIIVQSSGNIKSQYLSLLQETSIPNVRSLSGAIPGLDDKQQKELEERLENLGYK